MEYEQIKASVSPCGLSCETCFAQVDFCYQCDEFPLTYIYDIRILMHIIA